MGIDYGSKRIGVALSDERGQFAFPEAVLPNDKSLMVALATLAQSRDVGTVVCGLSLDRAGSKNLIAAACEAFATELTAVTQIPVEFEPEFYTSKEAAQIQGKTALLDASAAALILNSYLEKKNKNDTNIIKT